MSLLPATTTHSVSLHMRISLVLLLVLLLGCGGEPKSEDRLFTLLDKARTGVDFENTLVPEDDFNIIDYLYYYDGGGVAIGDINNDSLPDLFLTGNQVPDRLYLNRGNFRFDDVTSAAGILSEENSWSTGVSMADVNGDGWLDIYVCRVNHLIKAGHNQLYINQQDGTFKEESQRYGLDFEGLSTHTAWLDYDLDGDLDLYLLNHALHSRESYVHSWRRMIDAPRVGDKFYRQDDGYFVSIAAEAGIYSSALGYGLGIATSDLNQDGWPDLYIGNDFHEDDYLYLNTGLGTFTESLWKTTGQTSRSTMGVDIADLNNDGLPDIVALDMLPPDLATQRTAGNANADARMRILADFGYGPQVARNTLQLHRGVAPEGTPFFSEIASFAGITATDWSWAPLAGDFDGDGWKDLYITNGIPGRPNDMDYIEYVAAPDIQRILHEGSPAQEAEIALKMPAATVSNYAFKGGRNLQFEDVSTTWGIADPVIGNGAAYGDLDLDGDLDLIVNALNHPALIYRNESTNNHISVILRGTGRNTSAIGAKISVWASGIPMMQEQFPSRGFQSSVDHILSFGIGDALIADSVVVIWPSGLRSHRDHVSAGTRLVLDETDGRIPPTEKAEDPIPLIELVTNHGIAFTHTEDEVWDFEILPLLPYGRSTRGAALAVADVNGDQLEDIYLGGARGQPDVLYLQLPDGTFKNTPFPNSGQSSEANAALFFDADGDKDLDLYVVNGGWTGPAELHQDQLYINSGSGDFYADSTRLPVLYSNGTAVAAADIDLDGDLDLFVGSDTPPDSYAEAGKSSLLLNDGTGHFRDVTESYSAVLQHVGHVTGAAWADLVGDSLPDLVLVGEWMPVTIFENRGTELIHRTDSLGLSNSTGLWQSLAVLDLNGDGFNDLVAGNLGLNTVLDVPIALFADDFDQNGKIDPVIAQWEHEEWYAWASRDALLQHLPALSAKIPTYNAYKDLSITDLFGEDIQPDQIVQTLHSTVYWNRAAEHFTAEVMPHEVQWAPVMSLETVRMELGKGILLAGNLSAASDAFGASNASWGLLLNFTETGNMHIMHDSGFHVPGEARNIRLVRGDSNQIMVARSDDTPMIFKLSAPLTR